MNNDNIVQPENQSQPELNSQPQPSLELQQRPVRHRGNKKHILLVLVVAAVIIGGMIGMKQMQDNKDKKLQAERAVVESLELASDSQFDEDDVNDMPVPEDAMTIEAPTVEEFSGTNHGAH